MFKIKIIDIDLAKRFGILIEGEDLIWVNLEEGNYVLEKEATKFRDSESANEVVLAWEAIIKINDER